MTPLSPRFAARVLTVVAACAISGCATRAPSAAADGGVAVPAAWARGEAGGTASSESWWHALGDAQLAQLVEAAQEANTDVRTAQANLRQARALRDVAAAGARPSLSWSVSAQRRGGGGGASADLFDAGFDAGWEADVFGRVAHGTAAAEAQAQAGAGTLAATRLSVSAELALDYITVRATQARAAIARDSLASQEQTLQIAQWRERAGLGSAVDTAQALGAVEQTRAQLPAFQGNIEQGMHAIAVLVGQPPAALQSALSTPQPVPQPVEDFAVAIPARTLQQRPDVFAAQQQLEAAAQLVAQADAARRPQVQLSASLAWSAATLGTLGGVGAARTLLGLASQPLFDGGRLDAQLAAQRAAFDAAREGYRASVLTALKDVEDALAALAAARERLVSLQAAAAAARDAEALAGQRYASGIADFQVVLETQRTLLGVQDAVASAQADLAGNHVRLVKALGGGWAVSSIEKENVR